MPRVDTVLSEQGGQGKKRGEQKLNTDKAWVVGMADPSIASCARYILLIII